MDIISFGEALIDFKQQEGLNFAGFEGGSNMNVAVAVSRLGAEVGFGGQVSSDLFGEALRNHLDKNGVDRTFLLESDAPSTLAFVAEIDGDAHYSFMGENAADRTYNPQPRPTLPDSVKFIAFGSFNLVYDPTSSSITDIIAAHQDRCAIVLDPNVRPALTPDKAAYKENLKKWLALADIVKVSVQDLDWLEPAKSPQAFATEWLSYGPQAVIITDGEEGVTLYRDGKDPLKIPAPKVEVKDTVGAGDTFTGSMMVALLDKDKTADFGEMSDDTWRDVLNFAANAAAFNCTRDGADPPTRAELSEFMKSR